ncbi:uncharacterized protein LOC124999149 [Mugil cephalus]|uniref:uncharacterized protein LOC124999149 n=1 Tax=Mugil cephalus TaxID=48193 RepID=UPI001FB75131|nr:uncharacterized protein LOC124999149 [Mugil cephalus]
MSQMFCWGWFIVLIVVIHIEAQRKSSLNINSRCLGNIMRVDVSHLGGKVLEVAAVTNNSSFPLTPTLASQCGFSFKRNPLGNTFIYASLQNCFAQNVADETFTTVLHIRVSWNRNAADELYQVTETCHYSAWASREILCDGNYVEVSVKRAAPDDYTLPGHSIPETNPKLSDHRRAAGNPPLDAAFRITTVVFFTPEEWVMKAEDARRSGYWIASTPTRLVLRTPKNYPATYAQNVAGVPLKVFRTSTIFEQKWLATQIDATAACPMLEGSVSIGPETITWFLPQHIDPLVSSQQFTLLEVHMGIDGERLDPTEMQARGYSMSVNDKHVVVVIPVGAVGGHYKSHAQDNQYLISYTIEPMLELLWAEDAAHEDTRYKVLLPISMTFQPQQLQVTDSTVPEEGMFRVVLGQFALDVALLNVTFPYGALSVRDANARGFNIQEHLTPDGNMKVYTLEVPFTDPLVLQRKAQGSMVYALHITFDLLVLEEFVPFSHTAYLEAIVVDIVAPSISGGCNYQTFYVFVTHGSQGYNFETVVGKRILSPDLAQQYSLTDNGTHFRFEVPFSSPDVAYEAVESSSIRGRLDVHLRIPETNANIQEFSVGCSFLSTLTECFPNGTMTALAVKLESVPSLNPSQLTLSDPSCGPTYSDDRYAYFVFTGNTCGTTRRFLPNAMVYENEISLPDDLEKRQQSDSEEAEFELKVVCYYNINTTHAVAFHSRPRRSEPYAENAKGELQVEMRLSLDESFIEFYMLEDFPITKYLQQPLYFEVELISAAEPTVSLELENCWATLNEDWMSQPRWNLIINGCPNPIDPNQVVFHPVQTDDRVQHPSHYKRFEVQMFAFSENQEDLSDKLYVHCDVFLCDARNPMGGVCTGPCSNQENKMRGQRRANLDEQSFNYTSLGPIILG